MVSLICSLSELCRDSQLEEVSEANRKHERDTHQLELLTLYQKDKEYEVGDFMD